MILNIVAVLLILGITFFHSIFGLFSGLINVFCTIVSVCVALGFFEPLSNWITKDFEMHPGYAPGVCLLLLFVVSMIVLRSLADNLIRGNVRVPVAVDWGGGAVCGFLNAMCTVGIVVIGFLILPFGDQVMLYRPIERTSDMENNRAKFVRNSVWLNPNGFTLGLFNLLSSGSLKGGTTFASVYPSFSEWVAFTGNTVQPESTPAPYRDKSGDGYTGLKIEKWWRQSAGVEARYRTKVPVKMDPEPPYSPQVLTPAAGMELIGMNIAVTNTTGDRDKGGPVHRFRPTQFRIVGDQNGKAAQYTPKIIGGADPVLKGGLRIVDLDSSFSVEADAETPFDLYFEVEKGFQPRFLEYRRYARAAVSEGLFAKAPAGRELTIKTPEERREIERIMQGGFMGTVVDGTPADLEDLPFAVSAASMRDADVSVAEDRLLSGRYAGPRSKFEIRDQGAARVGKIKPPEGKRIVQIRCHPRQAKTLAGQVFDYVGSVVNQYFLIDEKGGKHQLAGYYILVKRPDGDHIEFIFAPDAGEAGFRGMVDPKYINRSELNASDDSILGLIFIVPTNTMFRRLENQRGSGVDVNFGSAG